MFLKQVCRTALFLLIFVSTGLAEQVKYEIGGPLAGVKLPLLPTEQGEPAGYPGCIPALQEKQTSNKEGWFKFSAQGNNPVLELRPGSPEIFMAYMDKYMPVRSMFDRQSQVQLWEARDLKQPVEQYAAPIFWVGRHAYGEPTGRFWKPRPVVRASVDSSTLSLNTRKLERGMYCVKVVGAVEPTLIQPFRKPLFLLFEINDGPNGEVNRYRYRAGYVEEFYSVAEIYFHATESRSFKIEVSVDRGSQVPLLIHAIELHDVLADITVEARKKRPSLFTPQQREQLRQAHADKHTVEAIGNSRLVREPADTKPLSREARFKRDELLWNSWIPLNVQVGAAYGRQGGYANHISLGAEGKSRKEIEEAYGAWKSVGSSRRWQPELVGTVLMTNEKLGLKYAMADLAQDKPLPDPYPYHDDGGGIYTPGEGEGYPQHWGPISDAVGARGARYTQFLNWTAVPSYHYAGNKSLGRDAAIMLIRLAYDWPAIDQANAISAVMSVPGGYGRDLHARQRMTTFYNWPWYTQFQDQAINYDLLFDLIDGNEELAESVSRFVPWVKSSKDVLALLDAYLLRMTAKRILRYNWFTGEMKIATMATIQDDTSITDDWMQWLFTRTWVYPLPTSGIADLMVSGCGRNGPEYIASTYYAMGENAMGKAMELEPYVNAGGNPKYNLSNQYLYPKPVMMCYWPMDVSVAGRQSLRIGDVAGPDKGPGYRIDFAAKHFRQGWKWTSDPKFAWLIKHDLGRAGEDDASWAAIEKAAATVGRAPYLDNPSRAVTQWASILESGRQHDDFRFRRTVYVRTGMGWGHHHNDTLDLQIYAHGLPMTVDGGQRPSYSKPGDRSTRMHNLVEVDGLGSRDGQWLGHSWTNALVDATGAQYMRLQAPAPSNHPDVKSYRRQVALIDVDEGEGSVSLPPEKLKTKAVLPKGVKTANSYVFDVVRVDGGKRHTYCFHAAISDEVTTNANSVQAYEQAGEKDQLYIGRMAGERSAGDAPDHFMATFRMARERQGIARSEKEMLGQNYDPDSPRKFTRLHLFGVNGQRALRGSLNCVKWKYQIPMVFVQKRGPDEDSASAQGNLQSAYAALIEPYVGEPIIKRALPLTIESNDTTADQAVALQVWTYNGHSDICFADGKSDVTRKSGDLEIAAEYAYQSVDKDGFRQATLVGGRLLKTSYVTIEPAQSQRIGKVTEADYANKTMTVAGHWQMPGLINRTFEIGTGDHWTTYTTTNIESGDGQSKISVRGGADFYLSRVKEVDTETNTVYCILGLAQNEGHPSPGLTKHWVASNEQGTKFWRAEYLGGDRAAARYGFKLDGPVSQVDFGEAGGFRLWEYGVGDTVRQSTFVNLRRLKGRTYELSADTAVKVTIADKTHDISLAQLQKNNGRIVLAVK